MDATFLQTLWFILIAVLFLGYFVLEGFDFGVGINVFALGKGDDTRKRQILRTISPVWDGNEVWLLVGGAGIFAAFPEWYATLFSGAYLALFLILLALIVRVCAFKYRDKVENPTWRLTWDWMHFLGGLLPALLWGVAFANIVRGVTMEANHTGASIMTSSLLDLLNPFGLLGGVVFVLLFWFHGTVYLSLKTTGEVRDDANDLAGKLAIPTIVAGAAFLIWHQLAYSNTPFTWAALVVAAVALVFALLMNRAHREGMAFTGTTVAIAAASIQLFGGLFPNVLPALNDSALSLTVMNASSTEYTLKVMTIATVVFLPIVLAYQAWAYWVFRHRVDITDINEASEGLIEKIGRAHKDAFGTE